MEKYQITSAFIGFLFAGLILWLVRRDRMHGRFALWWISVAIVFAVLGLTPRLVDQVASGLGIGYPPILAVILGIGFLILKIIMMDIERSTNVVKLQRLTQRMAILEGLLQNQNDKKNPGKSK